MFPARAGMSLKILNIRQHSTNVPRASGDEPKHPHQDIVLPSCSPRERG